MIAHPERASVRHHGNIDGEEERQATEAGPGDLEAGATAERYVQEVARWEMVRRLAHDRQFSELEQTASENVDGWGDEGKVHAWHHFPKRTPSGEAACGGPNARG